MLAPSTKDYAKEGGYTFDVRQNSRSQKVDWQLPLPNFKQNWTNLIGKDVLIPGHSTVSSFLPSSTSNNAPSANFVSAKILLGQCPPSLLQALHPSNPDKQVWLDSYNEEKGSYSKYTYLSGSINTMPCAAQVRQNAQSLTFNVCPGCQAR